MLIELRTFRLRPGVDDEQLIEADAAVQQRDLVFRPGFVRRTTGRSADGRWTHVTFWGDDEWLDAALADPTPEAKALDDLVDPESSVVDRFQSTE